MQPVSLWTSYNINTQNFRQMIALNFLASDYHWLLDLHVCLYDLTSKKAVGTFTHYVLTKQLVIYINTTEFQLSFQGSLKYIIINFDYFKDKE